MSAFKKLDKRDVYVTTYVAHKQHVITSESLNRYIQVLSGSYNTGSEIYPKSDYGFYGDNYGQMKVNYRSIKHLYYSNFTNPGIQSGSFENYIQTTLYQSGSRNLSKDEALDNGVDIVVLSFPREKIGTHILPGSLLLQGLGGNSYVDDEYDYVIETIEGGGQYTIPYI